MSEVMRDFDPKKPMDVPTMMKLLMLVYDNTLEDETMEEVAEALGDAICALSGMRELARQVMLEGSAEIEFSQSLAGRANGNLC